MNLIRKHKKISITIMIILVLFLSIWVVFGRYIHNIVNQYILETKGFYFNSSILNVNGKSNSLQAFINLL